MHNLTRQIVCLAMTGTLAIASLAGCGGPEGLATQQPSSAAELAEMNEKTAGARNYHFEGDFDLSLNVMGQAFPLKATVGGDYAEGNTHITSAMDVLGQKQESEMYLVKENGSYVQYSSTKTDGTTQWSKMPIGSNPVDSFSSKELLSAGEYSKDGDGYTVSLTGAQIWNAIVGSNKDLETALKDVNTADLQKSLENCKVAFKYDNAANNTSQTLNFNYGTTSEFMGQTVETNIKITGDMKLTNHGKVDASKVAVPESVKSSAVDATAGLNDLLKQLESLTGAQTTTSTSATTQSAA